MRTVPPAISPTTFALSVARTLGGVAAVGVSSRQPDMASAAMAAPTSLTCVIVVIADLRGGIDGRPVEVARHLATAHLGGRERPLRDGRADEFCQRGTGTLDNRERRHVRRTQSVDENANSHFCFAVL